MTLLAYAWILCVKVTMKKKCGENYRIGRILNKSRTNKLASTSNNNPFSSHHKNSAWVKFWLTRTTRLMWRTFSQSNPTLRDNLCRRNTRHHQRERRRKERFYQSDHDFPCDPFLLGCCFWGWWCLKAKDGGSVKLHADAVVVTGLKGWKLK